jgi:hypothetical protein
VLRVQWENENGEARSAEGHFCLTDSPTGITEGNPDTDLRAQTDSLCYGYNGKMKMARRVAPKGIFV